MRLLKRCNIGSAFIRVGDVRISRWNDMIRIVIVGVDIVGIDIQLNG